MSVTERACSAGTVATSGKYPVGLLMANTLPPRISSRTDPTCGSEFNSLEGEFCDLAMFSDLSPAAGARFSK